MLVTDESVLIIVDVQGKLARSMADRETLFDNLQRLIKGAGALGLPVLLAEQIPQKLGPTIPEVADLLPGLEPITKTSFSCAGDPGFMASLEALGRKQLLVAGIEAHVCVYQTAVDLCGTGYAVDVVEDAVASRSAANKAVALRRMSALGVGITCTEMALFELMGSSEHPAFRQIQALIR